MSPRRAVTIERDRMARFACLEAARGSCERCGASDGRLEWHHVITRRVVALRWESANSLALCQPCHRWWHGNPKAALEWFVGRFGINRLEYLHQRLRALRKKGGR